MDGTRCSRRDMSPAGRVRAQGLSRERVSCRYYVFLYFSIFLHELILFPLKFCVYMMMHVYRTVATAWRGRSPQLAWRGLHERAASLHAARCLHQPTVIGATQVPPAPADSANQSE